LACFKAPFSLTGSKLLTV